MNKIDKIKSKLGRNSFDRQEIGSIGLRTQGELRRARALRADHKRNIAQQGGYPDVITLRQHYDMAHRNGLGHNLAFGVVKDTWRVFPELYDGEEDAERRKSSPTEFEKAVDEHFERLNVWDRIKGLDYAQRPMRYGALMYVTSEQDATSTDDVLMRLPSIDYLVDLRVYHEAQLPVETAHQNPASINYGMPINYSIRTNVAGSTNEWENSGYKVHASRVFAFGEGALDGSIYGVPCNESCFEALMDCAKIRMSGAEGFYQNASNKYANTLPDNATAADAEEVLQSMEDFDNEMSRSLVTVGDIKMLQTTLSDPTKPWSVAFSEACAAHSKPEAVVRGEISGERASTENIKSWNREVMDRQVSVGNKIIKAFLKDIQEKFNFPKPSNYLNIVWRDLNESTADQQAALAKTRAETNKICIESRMAPVYSTEFMQAEAGAPVEAVVALDLGGEGDENGL